MSALQPPVAWWSPAQGRRQVMPHGCSTPGCADEDDELGLLQREPTTVRASPDVANSQLLSEPSAQDLLAADEEDEEGDAAEERSDRRDVELVQKTGEPA